MAKKKKPARKVKSKPKQWQKRPTKRSGPLARPEIQLATGWPKLSGAILEFADPLLKQSRSGDETEEMVVMCILLWNCCLEPEDSAREKYLECARGATAGESDTNPELRAGYERIFNVMYERRQLFAHDRRVCVKYEFIREPAGDFTLRTLGVLDS